MTEPLLDTLARAAKTQRCVLVLERDGTEWRISLAMAREYLPDEYPYSSCADATRNAPQPR